jgi:hypothetical protein
MTIVLCHCKVADYDAFRRKGAMEADGIDMSSVWVDHFDEIDRETPLGES